MLNTIANIILIVGVMFYGIKDYKKSVLIYAIGTFIAPVLRISGIDLSFDIVCFPLLFLCFLFNQKMKISIQKSNGTSFLPYLMIYLVFTLIGNLLYGGGISFATIYAILRFIIVLYILKNTWQGEMVKFLDKVLSWVVLLNVVCSVLQMTNMLPVEFFYDLYYKSSMKPLLNQLELGYFNRAYGTTGSPVILGGISALCYAFYLGTYVSPQYNIRRNVLKLLGCAICGLLALSKTAIIAIPIVSAFVLIMCVFYFGSSSVKPLLKIFGLFIIGITAMFYAVSWMQDNGFAIAYYLEFLKDPLRALNTRYDRETGNLSVAMDIIKSHPFFGVGHATFNNAFVGDSVYIVLLYQTGICGLLTYFVPYIVAFIRSMKKQLLLSSAILFTFVLIAIGNALHLSYFIIPFVALAFDNSLEKRYTQG